MNKKFNDMNKPGFKELEICTSYRNNTDYYLANSGSEFLFVTCFCRLQDKTFDSLSYQKLWKIIGDFGISFKLIRVIKKIHNKAKCQIIHSDYLCKKSKNRERGEGRMRNCHHSC